MAYKRYISWILAVTLLVTSVPLASQSPGIGTVPVAHAEDLTIPDLSAPDVLDNEDFFGILDQLQIGSAEVDAGLLGGTDIATPTLAPTPLPEEEPVVEGANTRQLAVVRPPVNKVKYSAVEHEFEIEYAKEVMQSGRFFFDVLVNGRTQLGTVTPDQEFRMSFSNKHLWNPYHLQKLYAEYWPDQVNRSDKSRYPYFTSWERVRLRSHYDATVATYGLVAAAVKGVRATSGCGRGKDAFLTKACWDKGTLGFMYDVYFPSLKAFQPYNAFLPEKRMLGMIYDYLGGIAEMGYNSDKFVKRAVMELALFLIPLPNLIGLVGRGVVWGGSKLGVSTLVSTLVKDSFGPTIRILSEKVGEAELKKMLQEIEKKELEAGSLQRLARKIHKYRYRQMALGEVAAGDKPTYTMYEIKIRRIQDLPRNVKSGSVRVVTKVNEVSSGLIERAGVLTYRHQSTALGQMNFNLSRVFRYGGVSSFPYRRKLSAHFSSTADALVTHPAIKPLLTTTQRESFARALERMEVYSSRIWRIKQAKIKDYVGVCKWDGKICLKETSALAEMDSKVGSVPVHEMVHLIEHYSAVPFTPGQYVRYRPILEGITETIGQEVYRAGNGLPSKTQGYSGTYIAEQDLVDEIARIIHMKISKKYLGFDEKPVLGLQKLREFQVRDGLFKPTGQSRLDDYLGNGVAEEVSKKFDEGSTNQAFDVLYNIQNDLRKSLPR